LSTINSQTPQRGDVWLVGFDPTLGSEIRKTRPAVVISSDAVGRLPVKLVAPVTDWKTHYAANVWHVRIDPEPDNGLSKTSAVDALQIRGMDRQRFSESSAESLQQFSKKSCYQSPPSLNFRDALSVVDV